MIKTAMKKLQGYFPVFHPAQPVTNKESSFNFFCAQYRELCAQATAVETAKKKKRKEILALYPEGHENAHFSFSMEKSLRDDPELVCLQAGLDPGSRKKEIVSFTLKEK